MPTASGTAIDARYNPLSSTMARWNICLSRGDAEQAVWSSAGRVRADYTVGIPALPEPPPSVPPGTRRTAPRDGSLDLNFSLLSGFSAHTRLHASGHRILDLARAGTWLGYSTVQYVHVQYAR